MRRSALALKLLAAGLVLLPVQRASAQSSVWGLGPYLQLPWPSAEIWTCTQGNHSTGDQATHTDGSGLEYAWDFQKTPGKRGYPFCAAAPGVVDEVHTGCVEGDSACGGKWGNYVLINHRDGTYGRYAHAQEILVQKGQYVHLGDVLGLVGATGYVTGPHLHFQLEERPASGKSHSIPGHFVSPDVRRSGGVPEEGSKYQAEPEVVANFSTNKGRGENDLTFAPNETIYLGFRLLTPGTVRLYLEQVSPTPLISELGESEDNEANINYHQQLQIDTVGFYRLHLAVSLDGETGQARTCEFYVGPAKDLTVQEFRAAGADWSQFHVGDLVKARIRLSRPATVTGTVKLSGGGPSMTWVSDKKIAPQYPVEIPVSAPTGGFTPGTWIMELTATAEGKSETVYCHFDVLN